MCLKIHSRHLHAPLRGILGPNSVSAAHCATRLRLVLRKSPPAEVTRRISELPAVIQVLERGGQYQIVIGVHAKDVYEELVKLLRLDQSDQPAQKQGILARVIATMSPRTTCAHHFLLTFPGRPPFRTPGPTPC